MLSIIHYISAGRRLVESEKTIHMMGGEDECQPMLLAQRDMIKLERDYYKEQASKFIGWFLFLLAIALVGAYLYFNPVTINSTPRKP